MKFNYQARTQKGDIQTGTIDAFSREAALVLLQKHKLFVTSLTEAEIKPFYAKKIKLFERISKKEIVAFSRQLSLMFRSRISLAESLRIIGKQTKNPNLKEKISILSEDIEGGTPFSKALDRFPKVFSPFYLNMIKSGEAAGTLSKSLDYLADHLEKEYHLRSKIQGAMIYPAMVVVVVISVLVLMMFFVIPQLAIVLEETGQELPAVTRLVIGFSYFIRSWGWAVSLVFLGILIFAVRYFKKPSGRQIWHRFILHLPLVSNLLKMIYLSRFAENFSTLIAGGLPIVKALEITAETVDNNVYQTIINHAKEEVVKGGQVSQVFFQYPEEFPPLLTQMVVVGEKTGTLDQSLTGLVDFYNKEIERTINHILSVLEPFLIIFLGLIVAGLMASVLIPLYGMTAI